MASQTVSELNRIVEDVLNGVEYTQKLLRRKKTAQVRTSEEKEIIKSIALAWFEKYKDKFPITDIEWETLSQIDSDYKSLLEWSSKSTSRFRYLGLLGSLKAKLIQLRSEIFSNSYKKIVPKNIPNLTKLVPNSDMRQIIYRRWRETEKCIEVAPLAATVMMGALLEALFLARINKLDNKSVIFRLKSTPLDKSSQNPLNLSEWTLKHFIHVAHEMEWIRKAAKDISSVMMEYRNLIHPEKELRLGVILEPRDAAMFWAVFIQLSEQIINSIT